MEDVEILDPDPKNAAGFVRELFKLLDEVIAFEHPLGGKISSPMVVYYRKYKGIWIKTHPMEHYQYFTQIYGVHTESILDGLSSPKSNAWLKTGRIELQYGGEGKEFAQYKIMLSEFYKRAIAHRIDTENKVKGHGEEAYQNKPELIRDDVIYLALYRIFHCLCEKADEKDKLIKLITKLEQDLGLNSTAAPTGLGGLFGMAQDLLGKVGIERPTNSPLPSDQDFQKAIGGVFNNPQTQNALGGMFKKLQGAQSLPDAISGIFGALNEGPMKDVLATTIQSTVSDAAKMSGTTEAAKPLPPHLPPNLPPNLPPDLPP